MEPFRWNKYFETGFASIDQEHFQLVGLINNFGKLLEKNELLETDIEDVFQTLKEYAIYHFQEEEALMKKAGIDSRFLSLHIKVHQDFLLSIEEMHEELIFENSTTSKHLINFLSHWLVNHILGMDQSLAGQLNAIDNGSTAAQAFAAENTAINNASEALLTALNNLFQDVSERNKELQRLNQTLEIKVAQRTQALQEANKHLKQLAVTDPLTNLPNRRYAMQHLSALWKTAQQQNLPPFMYDDRRRSF